MESRVCPECGNVVRGRQDKKYCSDGCRNSFNNKLNSDRVNLMRRINNRIRKNQRVLSALNISGKTKTHRDEMLLRGFDFHYFTHVVTTKKGSEYRFCYDEGYLKLDEGYILLVKREDS